MQDNFNFKAWLQEHRSGPYSKDNANYGKRNINESVEEAMDLTPPSPDKIYQSDSEDSADISSVEMAEGLVNMTLLTRVVRELAEEDDNFEKSDIVEAISNATEKILEDLLDDLDWDRPLDPTFREDLSESSVKMAEGLVNMPLLTRVVRELAEEDYNFEKSEIVQAIRRATEKILEDLLDDLDWDRPLGPTFREDLDKNKYTYGQKISVDYWGPSDTARTSFQPKYYKVLSDDGDYVTAESYDDGSVKTIHKSKIGKTGGVTPAQIKAGTARQAAAIEKYDAYRKAQFGK